MRGRHRSHRQLGICLRKILPTHSKIQEASAHLHDPRTNFNRIGCKSANKHKVLKLWSSPTTAIEEQSIHPEEAPPTLFFALLALDLHQFISWSKKPLPNYFTQTSTNVGKMALRQGAVRVLSQGMPLLFLTQAVAFMAIPHKETLQPLRSASFAKIVRTRSVTGNAHIHEAASHNRLNVDHENSSSTGNNLMDILSSPAGSGSHHHVDRENDARKSSCEVVQASEAVKRTIGKTLIKSIASDLVKLGAFLPLSALASNSLPSSDTASDFVIVSLFAMGAQVRALDSLSFCVHLCKKSPTYEASHTSYFPMA